MHPRTYSESLDLIGPAICASIDDEQQDSLCIYLKGLLHWPLENNLFLTKNQFFCLKIAENN